MPLLPSTVSTMRNIVELMVDNCAKEIFLRWGARNEALKMLKTAGQEIHEFLLTKDAKEVFPEEKELCDTLYARYTMLCNGVPLIRTFLSGLWYVKVSMNPDFKQEICHASRLKGKARRECFKQISDKYFEVDVCCKVYCRAEYINAKYLTIFYYIY